MRDIHIPTPEEAVRWEKERKIGPLIEQVEKLEESRIKRARERGLRIIEPSEEVEAQREREVRANFPKEIPKELNSFIEGLEGNLNNENIEEKIQFTLKWAEAMQGTVNTLIYLANKDAQKLKESLKNTE